MALLETRKREGKQVWTPVDHGDVFLTDRQAIFSGSKDVKFRYDKIISRQMTAQGLFLGVSLRKRSHILAGPAGEDLRTHHGERSGRSSGGAISTFRSHS